MKKLIPTISVSFFIILITVILSFAFLKNRTRKVKYDNEAEKYNIDNRDYNLVQYKDFSSLKEYIYESKENFEILYFGYPDCPYCNTYTPIINKVTKNINKPVLYYNIESIKEPIIDENKVATNTDEYNKVLEFIIDMCPDAKEKEYIKDKEIVIEDVTTILTRLYVPRYFIIKNKKIVDCFMPKSVNNIDLTQYTGKELEEKQKYIEEEFKTFIGKYL